MTIFFISDTHLCHANFLKFKDKDDKLIRPFASVEEMNERIVEGWNSSVKDGDHVYHLGDVTFDYGKDFRSLMSRLRGRKRLLIGNHDIIKGTNLLDFFEKVGLWRIFKDEKFICSHVPMHHEQFRAKCEVNVHGHMHQNIICLPNGNPDPRYMSVCVEQVNYVPISMDEIKQRMAA